MKSINIIALIPLLACFINAVETVHAQDPVAYDHISFLTEKTGFGARAIGLGGAYLAVADDYSAIHWNPAGLGMLTQNQVFASLSHNNRVIDTQFLNVPGNNSKSKTAFDALGFVYSVDVYQGNLVFAGGFNRVQNFNSFFGYRAFNSGETYIRSVYNEPFIPNDITQDETIEIEGSVSQFSVAGAYEAAENLFLGLTLDIWAGENIHDQLFAELDVDELHEVMPNDVFAFQEERIFNTDIGGLGALFGILFLPVPEVRLGLTINSPRYLILNEDWKTSQILEFDNGDDDVAESQGSFEYEVRLPFEFGIGASYDFTAGIITGDIRYTDWSQLRFLGDTPLEGFTKSLANRNIKQTVEGVLSTKVGLEIHTGEKVSLRTGFSVTQSPLKNADSKNDRKDLSLGAGIALSDMVVFDIAYRRSWWESVTVSSFNDIPVGEEHVDQKIFTSLSINFLDN